jgi:hypothetical protein
MAAQYVTLSPKTPTLVFYFLNTRQFAAVKSNRVAPEAAQKATSRPAQSEMAAWPSAQSRNFLFQLSRGITMKPGRVTGDLMLRNAATRPH